MSWHKRIFDIAFSMLLIILLFLPLHLVLALGIKLTSRGQILHWSKRVGRNNKLFLMPKYRTMRIETPQVPTHLLLDPVAYLTPAGKLLRLTSLDELPQLFSILVGDLSFVGPRPALFNQNDLIALRSKQGIHMLVPGLTGWAQINGRDELSLLSKVQFDYEYLIQRSFTFDLKIICMTVAKVIRGEGIQH